MRLIEIKFIGRGRRTLANPIATLALIPFVSVPQILGVYFSNSLNAGILSAFVMLFLFVITYFYGLKLGRSGHLRNKLFYIKNLKQFKDKIYKNKIEE